jgi:hypothetical protein
VRHPQPAAWIRGASIVAAAAAAALVPSPAHAQAPPNYVAALVTTTPAYRPPGGPWEGFQHDLTLNVGYGRYVTKTLALELDAGPTWVSGDYAAFALMPGLVWSFHPHVYAAARFVVPVDPEINFALAPGVGLLHTFANGVSPYLELNAISYVGRGDPDLAIALTAGVLFSF